MDPSSSSPLPAENVSNKPREAIIKVKNACNDEQIRTEALKLDLTLVSVSSLFGLFTGVITSGVQEKCVNGDSPRCFRGEDELVCFSTGWLSSVNF